MNKWLRHDKDYTQGFKMINGKVLQSTGLYKHSTVKWNVFNQQSFKTHQAVKLDDSQFGEGIDLIKVPSTGLEYIFQLTWQERVINVYYPETLKQVSTIELPKQIKEGWGLTHNPSKTVNNIYVTDGSELIFTCSADFVQTTKKFSFICDEGKRVKSIVNGKQMYQTKLNEMEFHKGYLYINQYMTNNVLIFDIEKWLVVNNINMSYLKSQANDVLLNKHNRSLRNGEVLNGITYDSQEKLWQLTGKNWPMVFGIKWLALSHESNSL